MPRKGHVMSTDQKEKIRIALTGKKFSQERRANISAAKSGNPPSPNAIVASRLVTLGKKLSPEHRAKISVAKTGKKNSTTHVTKMRHARLGKKHSPETKEKIRAYCNTPYAKKRSASRLGASLSPDQYCRVYPFIWYGSVTYREKGYCDLWNENLRERCRSYFGYQDPISGTPQNGIRLHVHHVLWNKKTCCDNSKRYLLPLDNADHARVRGNKEKSRKDWMNELSTMIEDYYQGKCFWSTNEWEIMKNAPNIPLETRYNPGSWVVFMEG